MGLHDFTESSVWTGGDARIQSGRGISPDTEQLNHMKPCMRQISGRDDLADFESLVDGRRAQLVSETALSLEERCHVPLVEKIVSRFAGRREEM